MAHVDNFPSTWDQFDANESPLTEDRGPRTDGLRSMSDGSEQSRILGTFIRIQPTGSPEVAYIRPFARGYRNSFLGEISDAGNYGIACGVFISLIPRILEVAVTNRKSKDIFLPSTFRFRALSGIVYGSYIATYWLAIATALSLTGIDTKASSQSCSSWFIRLPNQHQSQEEQDGRNEIVAE